MKIYLLKRFPPKIRDAGRNDIFKSISFWALINYLSIFNKDFHREFSLEYTDKGRHRKFPLRQFKGDVTMGGGGRYSKQCLCWHGGGVYAQMVTSPLCISSMFKFRTYEIIFPTFSLPTCILAKATEVTSGVWQRVMRTCGDKKSIYIMGRIKLKKTFTLCFNFWYYFLMINRWFLGTWIVKNSMSLFASWHGGRGRGELVTNGDMGEGGLKIAIFAERPF